MLCIVGDCMIVEAEKELIDKREFYQSILNQMKQHGDATLNSTLTLREIVEVFDGLPLYNEPHAEWVLDKIEKKLCLFLVPHDGQFLYSLLFLLWAPYEKES